MSAREIFVCPECGLDVSADEDGCCATCGSDCTTAPHAEYVRASRLALAERVREACAERVRQWLESLPNAKVSEDRTRPVGWIPTINTPDACVKFVKDTDLSKLVEGE